MTNLFIADHYQKIRNTDEVPLRDGMVEILDTMLTDNSVQHYFSLPFDTSDDTELLLCYDGKDDMAFFLVYALWMKTVRRADDKHIVKAMLKHCAGYDHD